MPTRPRPIFTSPCCEQVACKPLHNQGPTFTYPVGKHTMSLGIKVDSLDAAAGAILVVKVRDEPDTLIGKLADKVIRPTHSRESREYPAGTRLLKITRRSRGADGTHAGD